MEIRYDAASYANIAPDRSVHQSDARIFHQPNFTYDEVKTFGVPISQGNEVLHLPLQTESGATATLLIRSPGEEMLRLSLVPAEADPPPTTSEMLVDTGETATRLEFQEQSGGLRFRFGKYALILRREPFGFFIEKEGANKPVFTTEHYPLAGKPLVGALGFRTNPGTGTTEPYLSWKIRNGERFFGLGEKWNAVEKSGTRATIWASDTCGSNSNDLSYKSLPYLLSTRGWGLFLHNAGRSFWEVGNFSYVSGSCCTEDAAMDAFFFFGDNPQELIRRYTLLTGRPRPVPDWVFGVWISRCQFENRDQAEESMDGFRTRGIPADVVHLDPLWMRTHYYFRIGVDACDFVKNEEAFPNLPDLWKKWRQNGFKTCLWVNPYLPEGTPIYEEAATRGYLLRAIDGGLARLSHGEAVGMVDFFHPEAYEWWKEYLRTVLREGAAVLKPDYGDRVPENALTHDGRTGRQIHNLYLFWFTRACYEAVEEVHGCGFVWRRSGYIGSQRYPGTWAGDTRSTWEEMLACLRGGLSAGFNGEALWGGDIGGFTGPEPSPELYIRWAQWGLLSPLARFHGTNCPREPWYFGEKAVEVVRHYARLRYRLVPYLKRCFAEACATGLPLLRHLALQYPSDPVAHAIDDQYLLGPDLLVAPVFHPDERERRLYLPAGNWTAWDDETTFAGEHWITVPAPLERIPLFRRSDAEIPVDTTERSGLT